MANWLEKRRGANALRASPADQFQGMADNAPVGSVGAPGGLLAPPTQKPTNYLRGLLGAASFAPGIGDAAGIAADAQMYLTDPSSRTPGNFALSALGALPFVPSMAGSKMANAMSDSIAEFPDEFTKSVFEYGRKLRDQLLPEAHEVFGKTTFSNRAEIPLTMDMLDKNDISMLLGRASRKGIYEDLDKVFSGPRGPHDEAASVFYESGLYGRPLPPYVEGWRYGEIPDQGKSFNYRDQNFEKGVSLMSIDGEDPSDAAKVFEMLNKGGKKKYRVGGYFVGRGADGEPLLVRAKNLGEIND
jgi:hypothetical protein